MIQMPQISVFDVHLYIKKNCRIVSLYIVMIYGFLMAEYFPYNILVDTVTKRAKL